MSNSSFVVGLAGGSASGKTSIIHALSEHFSSDELAVISQDNYYKPLSQQRKDERGEVNFDDPAGIDFKRLRKDLRTLMKGEPVEIVEYTFNDPTRFPRNIVIAPARILLVEGLFIYTDPLLKKCFDWRLFVDTDMQVAKKRRLHRDVAERGMQRELVHYQWDKHVLPAFDTHVAPHLSDVHFTIDNNHHFDEHLPQITARFRAFLDSK